MERTPEPELMIDEAQALAYAGADFDEPHNHFIKLLRECLPNLRDGGTALDLGCGPGDISMRFARAFPSWKVDGLDGSPAMVHVGAEIVQRAGLTGRVHLITAYLPEGDAPRDSYDLVFSNSLLHHLADPTVMWSSVTRWAGGGTPVFIMDLMRPASREQARELLEQYARGEPEVMQRDFYNSLLAAYEPAEVCSQLQDSGLAHLQIRITSDRHFIVWGQI